MSELDKLKQPVKPKAYLKNINLRREGAHIAMTTGSGAASLMNESFIMKSLGKAPLTEEDIYILKEIGEYDESLEEGTESSEDDNTGVIQKTINETKEESMSDTVSKEAFVAIQKKLLKTEVAHLGLADEMQTGLVDVLVTLDEAQSEVITKALEAVVASKEAEKEEAITKAVEAAKPVEAEETEIAKKLQAESGHAEAEAVVTKSLVEQAQEIIEEGAK